jgi:hypothetical protein
MNKLLTSRKNSSDRQKADAGLNADQLSAVYAFVGTDGHPDFGISLWKVQVASNKTQMSYWQWVATQIVQVTTEEVPQ